LLPLALVLSWLLRVKLSRYVVAIATAASKDAAWYAALPRAYQLALLALVPIVALEVWFVDIKWVLYGSLWRSIYPDLVLTSDTSSLPRVVGRAYRVERAAPDRVVIHFAKRGGGIFQRFHGLQRLEASSTPRRLNARQVALQGEAIEEASPGVWRVTDASIPTHPTSKEAPSALLTRPLQVNQLVSKEGLEGNPHHLARVPQLVPGRVKSWEE
jgi:hypothetical protein